MHTLQVQQFLDLSGYVALLHSIVYAAAELSFCVHILKEDLYVNLNFASKFL